MKKTRDISGLAEKGPDSHHDKIIDFFNSEYGWWGDVYDETLPKKFFSFEMIKRKQLLIETLKEYTSAGKSYKILECGCGPGGIIKEIALHECELTGVDISFDLLTKAKKNIGNGIAWIQSDVEMLPFPDETFDIVYCVGVLSYLEKDEEAIKEITRVVVSGGMVIFSLPNWFMINKFLDPFYYIAWLPFKIINKLRRATAISTKKDAAFASDMIRRYGYKSIHGLFEKNNLILLKTINVSFGPLTLWRCDLLPLSMSVNLSETLRAIGEKKGFHFLKFFTNHWITCLSKSNA